LVRAEFQRLLLVEWRRTAGLWGDGEVTTVQFGPNASAKYITTYFRRAFEISDPAVFRSLKLRVVRDDGVVVRLNAVEVFRSNMPTGAISFTTLASASLSGGDEFIAEETNLPPALLRPGTNVLAVEVHQSGGSSSDLGFDLALDAEYVSTAQPLRLTMGPATNANAVGWPLLSVGHVLQSTTRLAPTNPWSTVTNAVSISSTNYRVLFSGGSNRFFRLRSAPVDASTLSNKLMFGYQGWFACSNERDYLPVIWPGFSWKNLNAGPLNQIPRTGGRFWWRQLYNAQLAGCNMIYGAMFDEVDEGTAMFKLAPTAAQLPAQGMFVPLNIDGEALPSDWYLRLAGEGGRMLRGEIPLTSTRPINP
jgi:hypothetical protein